MNCERCETWGRKRAVERVVRSKYLDLRLCYACASAREATIAQLHAAIEATR